MGKTQACISASGKSGLCDQRLPGTRRIVGIQTGLDHSNVERRGWAFRGVTGRPIPTESSEPPPDVCRHRWLPAGPDGAFARPHETGVGRLAQPPSFTIVLNPVMPGKEELAALAGDYRSADADARYQVFLSEQGRLTISTSGGLAEIRLEPGPGRTGSSLARGRCA